MDAERNIDPQRESDEMDLPPDYDDKIIERPRDKATKAVDQPPEEVRHFGVKRTRDEDEFDKASRKR